MRAEGYRLPTGRGKGNRMPDRLKAWLFKRLLCELLTEPETSDAAAAFILHLRAQQLLLEETT